MKLNPLAIFLCYLLLNSLKISYAQIDQQQSESSCNSQIIGGDNTVYIYCNISNELYSNISTDKLIQDASNAYYGENEKINFSDARRYIEEAVARGDSIALFTKAAWILEGKAYEQDFSEAEKLLQESFLQGYTPSAFLIAKIREDAYYYFENNPYNAYLFVLAEAIHWYLKIAESQNNNFSSFSNAAIRELKKLWNQDFPFIERSLAQNRILESLERDFPGDCDKLQVFIKKVTCENASSFLHR